MRRKRPDTSTSRQEVLTDSIVTGSVTLCAVEAIEPTHSACVAVGLVLLFCRIEYGQSGTDFA
jgi:hypothetical protein